MCSLCFRKANQFFQLLSRGKEIIILSCFPSVLNSFKSFLNSLTLHFIFDVLNPDLVFVIELTSVYMIDSATELVLHVADIR